MNPRYSAIVVTVKQQLLEWVRKQGIRRPYFPEEDCVWLVPSRSEFALGQFEQYVNDMKDAILDAELQRFGLNLRERILKDHAFDDLIHLAFRDDVERGPDLRQDRVET
jgi:hypothetical protein